MHRNLGRVVIVLRVRPSSQCELILQDRGEKRKIVRRNEISPVLHTSLTTRDDGGRVVCRRRTNDRAEHCRQQRCSDVVHIHKYTPPRFGESLGCRLRTLPLGVATCCAWTGSWSP